MPDAGTATHAHVFTSHWFMVPRKIRDLVWKHYIPGQEITKTPTREYLEVMKQAIEAVAAKEKEMRERKERNAD